MTPEREALEIQKLQLELREKELVITDKERAAKFGDRRVYPFAADVCLNSTQHCIRQLSHWAEESHDQMTVVFTTPGGAVFDGMALFDFIRELTAAGYAVETRGSGWIASMGSILLQAGSVRTMTPNSWLMLHEASTRTWGNVSQLRDEVALMDKIEVQMLDVLAERSKLTARQIKTRTARKDWWMQADEALKHGFVDAVV